MSIALSAVILPSRRLRWALLAYASAHGLAATLLYDNPRFAGAGWLALACALVACICLWQVRRPPITRRIDISGLGALTLTVQGIQGLGPLNLLSGSTLWPSLLLLRLGWPDGRRSVLLLLPDSVAGDSFRALAVALRHLAVRKKHFSKIKEIL